MTLTVRDNEANLFFQYNLTGDVEPMFTSIGIQLETGLTLPEAVSTCILALNAGHNDLAVQAPSEYSLGPGHVELGVTDGDNIRVDGTTTTTGLQVADATQQNTAVLVKKSTVRGGRSGRGRMFIPGAVDAFISPAGVLDVEYVDDFQTTMEEFASSILAVDGVENLLLFHEAEEDGTQLIALTVDNRCATQRRRLR